MRSTLTMSYLEELYRSSLKCLTNNFTISYWCRIVSTSSSNRRRNLWNVSGRELGRESKGCRRCQEWKRNRLRNYCMARLVRYAHSPWFIRSSIGSWWCKSVSIVLWEGWRWRWSILEDGDLSWMSKRTVRSPLSFPLFVSTCTDKLSRSFAID